MTIMASSESCCAVDYQSAVEDATTSSWSPDQSLTWLYSIALVFWPYPDALFTTSAITHPPNPDWLCPGRKRSYRLSLHPASTYLINPPDLS